MSRTYRKKPQSVTSDRYAREEERLRCRRVLEELRLSAPVVGAQELAEALLVLRTEGPHSAQASETLRTLARANAHICRWRRALEALDNVDDAPHAVNPPYFGIDLSSLTNVSHVRAILAVLRGKTLPYELRTPPARVHPKERTRRAALVAAYVGDTGGWKVGTAETWFSEDDLSVHQDMGPWEVWRWGRVAPDDRTLQEVGDALYGAHLLSGIRELTPVIDSIYAALEDGLERTLPYVARQAAVVARIQHDAADALFLCCGEKSAQGPCDFERQDREAETPSARKAVYDRHIALLRRATLALNKVTGGGGPSYRKDRRKYRQALARARWHTYVPLRNVSSVDPKARVPVVHARPLDAIPRSRRAAPCRGLRNLGRKPTYATALPQEKRVTAVKVDGVGLADGQISQKKRLSSGIPGTQRTDEATSRYTLQRAALTRGKWRERPELTWDFRYWAVKAGIAPHNVLADKKGEGVPWSVAWRRSLAQNRRVRFRMPRHPADHYRTLARLAAATQQRPAAWPMWLASCGAERIVYELVEYAIADLPLLNPADAVHRVLLAACAVDVGGEVCLWYMHTDAAYDGVVRVLEAAAPSATQEGIRAAADVVCYAVTCAAKLYSSPLRSGLFAEIEAMAARAARDQTPSPKDVHVALGDLVAASIATDLDGAYDLGWRTPNGLFRAIDEAARGPTMRGVHLRLDAYTPPDIYAATEYAAPPQLEGELWLDRDRDSRAFVLMPLHMIRAVRMVACLPPYAGLFTLLYYKEHLEGGRSIHPKSSPDGAPAVHYLLAHPHLSLPDPDDPLRDIGYGHSMRKYRNAYVGKGVDRAGCWPALVPGGLRRYHVPGDGAISRREKQQATRAWEGRDPCARPEPPKAPARPLDVRVVEWRPRGVGTRAAIRKDMQAVLRRTAKQNGGTDKEDS